MPDDQTLTTLTASLTALRDERAGLVARVEVLDGAIAGLEAAVASLDGTAAVSAPAAAAPAATEAPAAPSTRRRRARRTSSPKVGADDLVGALRAAGGSATTAELVTALGVNDGRNLNGARRQAVDDGLLVVDDGTYRLTDAGSAGTDAADDRDDGDAGDPAQGDGPGADDVDERDDGAEQASLTDAEWEASSTSDGDLGRRFP